MKHRILSIRMKGKKICWSVIECDREGKLEGAPDEIEVDFKLSSVQQRTIDFLAGMRHFMSDLRRSTKLKPEEGDMTSIWLDELDELLGENLYQILLRQDNELDKMLNEIRQQITYGEVESLRIQLSFEDECMTYASWPWEYLRSPHDDNVPGSGAFLAVSHKLMLNRRLPLRKSKEKAREKEPDDITQPKVKVLLIVARPKDEELGTVLYRVRDTLKELSDLGIVELIELIEPDPSKQF